MKCETCQGRGFIEYEAGLIMVECEKCEGTGEIDDVLMVKVLEEEHPKIKQKKHKPRGRKVKSA